MGERHIVVGNRSVMVRDASDPDGAPVVYCHGSPGSRLDLRTAEAFAEAEGIRLVSFDRPGYGRSDRAPFGLHRVALDVERIVDELGIGSFATLGWSGGGPFALAAAAVLGARVTGVGVACGPGPFQEVAGALDELDASSLDALTRLPDDPEGAVERFCAGSELLLSVRDDETIFMDGMEAMFGGADRDVLSDAARRHHLYGTLREGLAQGFTGVGWDNVAWVGPWDVDVRAVGCPVHLWYGEDDPSIPLAHGRWLADHLDEAELVVVAGAGHLWPMQRWEAMLRTVTAHGRRARAE